MPASEAHARSVVREVVALENLQAAAQQVALALGAFDANAYAADKALLNRSLKADLTAAIETSAKFHGHGKH
jgi:enoyl-CoA hydratase/carnithine racemase